MLNKERLQETAMRVRDLTPARVAELTGMPPRKVARFVNDPESVTMPEYERIKKTVAFLSEGRCLECGNLLLDTEVAAGVEYHEGCA